MPISQEEIYGQLDRLKQDKKRKDYLKPDDFKNFLPKTLGFQPRDTDQYYRILNSINEVGRGALELERTKAQNRYAYQEMLRAKKQAQLAKIRQQQLAKAQSNVYVSGGGGGGNAPVPKGGPLDINAGLGHYKFRNFNLTLNRSVANRFIGFLGALWAQGYRPKSIGSFSDRNIAGTNVKSLHAYGLAIDIDPSKNPVTWNGQIITALPPGVGALAARYGLVWGGNWHGSKRDTMHFSVPYGGRK